MKVLKLIFALAVLIGIIAGGYYLYRYISSRQLEQTSTIQPTAAPLPPDQQVDERGPLLGVNVTLSPVFINLIAEPGASVSAQFKVLNNNAFTENFKIDLFKFAASASGDSPVPMPITPEDEFVKWITFTENEFDIEPNQSKTVKFTVSVPKNAGLGYYFAIAMQRRQERVNESTGAVIAGSPTVPVLLEVQSSTAKKQARLLSFTTTKPVFEYLPVEFDIKLRNDGNVHLVPFGDIFITQGDDKIVGNISANESRGNILPNTARSYTAKWTDGFLVTVPKKVNGIPVLDSRGQAVMETRWDLTALNKFRIGKYDATAVMVYNDGQFDVPLEAKVSFWVFPWKIILAVVIVLLLILFGIFSIIRTISSSFRSGNRQ